MPCREAIALDFDGTAAPLVPEPGTPAGTVGTVEDITGRKELESQLLQAQKMEAIGKLAGGVAHDFNNMLTAILGYASMIHEDAPAGSPYREQAGQIRRAAESAAALTQKLLAFSRRQVLQPAAEGTTPDE